MNVGEKVDMRSIQDGTSEIDIRKIQTGEQLSIDVDELQSLVVTVTRRSMFHETSGSPAWIELRAEIRSETGDDSIPETIYLSQQLKDSGTTLAPPIIVDPQQQYIGTITSLHRESLPNIVQRLLFSARRIVDEEILH